MFLNLPLQVSNGTGKFARLFRVNSEQICVIADFFLQFALSGVKVDFPQVVRDDVFGGSNCHDCLQPGSYLHAGQEIGKEVLILVKAHLKQCFVSHAVRVKSNTLVKF